ncbi:hypothetical protein [Streptomyces odontomachi]|nr:hypothetical protein [Streptomyces sp. ODS25]
MRKVSRLIAVALLAGVSVVGVAGTAGAINCGPCYGCCVAQK